MVAALLSPERAPPADTETPDAHGRTALHFAAQSEGVTRALLAAGASWRARDVHGQTAEGEAKKRGCAAVEAEWRRAIALMHSVGRSTCTREERAMSGRCGRGAFTLPGFEHRRASDRLRGAALCEAVEPSIRVDDDRDEAV